MTAEPLDVRRNLLRLAREQGQSLLKLSIMLERSESYLQQFLNRGPPRPLPENDRLKLAKHLNVDERLLGARDPWTPN